MIHNKNVISVESDNQKALIYYALKFLKFKVVFLSEIIFL